MSGMSSLELCYKILIHASRERVFRALSNPRDIIAWWNLPGLYAVTEAEIDLREGGAYRLSGTSANAGRFVLTGEYLTVEPPQRLKFTWVPDWSDDARDSVVEFRLETEGDATRVVVNHTGFLSMAARDEHRQGWPAVLAALDDHVSGTVTGTP
jgi:uncharacterized protein YndB with AHSA1/START domain